MVILELLKVGSKFVLGLRAKPRVGLLAKPRTKTKKPLETCQELWSRTQLFSVRGAFYIVRKLREFCNFILKAIVFLELIFFVMLDRSPLGQQETTEKQKPRESSLVGFSMFSTRGNSK